MLNWPRIWRSYMCLPKSPIVIVCCFMVLNHMRRSSDLVSSKISSNKVAFITENLRASVVDQWKRICLPMQETQVQSLVWEDCTCRGAPKSAHRNYWVCALGPGSHDYRSPLPRARLLNRRSPAMRSPCTQRESSPGSQPEKNPAQQWRPHTAKANQLNK